MKYFPLILLVGFVVVAAYVHGRVVRARKPADLEAINRLADSRGLRVREIRESSGQWRYWLRGNLLLSNIARIYILIAEDQREGVEREIHLAFDPLSRSKDPIILQEK